MKICSLVFGIYPESAFFAEKKKGLLVISTFEAEIFPQFSLMRIFYHDPAFRLIYPKAADEYFCRWKMRLLGD